MEQYTSVMENRDPVSYNKCINCLKDTIKKPPSVYIARGFNVGTIAIFFFSCMTLACNLWILKLNYEIDLNKEMTKIREHMMNAEGFDLLSDDADDNEGVNDLELHYIYRRDAEKKKKSRNRKRGPCKCKRGKRGKNGKKGPKGDQGPVGNQGLQGPKGEKGDPGEIMKPEASHYTSSFKRDINTKDESWTINQNGIIRPVECNKMWHGTVCRNRTYTSINAAQTLPFLDKSDWPGIENPFTDVEKGMYKAKESGIYLVYFHVVFYDIAPKEEIALIHHRNYLNADTVLRCVEGHDSYLHGPKKYKNKKMKTCSITSVLYVQRNDVIEIQNKIAGTTIDLTQDATYFGAVLLSKTFPKRTKHP